MCVWCLQMGLGVVIMPPVIAAFTWILIHTGPMMPIYLWCFMFGLQIFFMTIYPVAIAPLFNKFSPLEKGTLRWAKRRPDNAHTGRLAMRGMHTAACCVPMDQAHPSLS